MGGRHYAEWEAVNCASPGGGQAAQPMPPSRAAYFFALPGLFAPISKCLQRLSGCCILYLQSLHSMRSVTFFVVFAFFLNTGLD